MAPRRAVKLNKFDLTNLKETDVHCPLCRTILIEPISLPCAHSFCASCFAANHITTNCPICQVRIGSWLRTAKKSDKLINQSLWNCIKEQFASLVRKKLHGSIIDKHDAGAGMNPNGVISKSNTETSKMLNEKNYTCRILYQPEPAPSSALGSPRLGSPQPKNKLLAKVLATDETSNDRSNSIESEYLYFRPIDYRRNPPSEGLPPIKVPTLKPTPTNKDISPPSGQYQLNINAKSAFVLVKAETKKESGKTIAKRKMSNSSSESKKRLRSYRKDSQESVDLLDSDKCETMSYLNVEIKRKLQEKRDFEFAKQLQEQFNSYLQYSTRSRRVKQDTSRPINNNRFKGMMSYKVK